MRKRESAAKDIKGKLDFNRVAHDIVNTPVDEFTNETYFLYAASVILDRALIGEDGLLPVQKRILWAMYVNHIWPTSQYAKVLSIIGDVAKYHPHGDQSIGSSIVRMAQPYSLRTTLVDGSGNFASVPGDDASAPRYIDARMTKAAFDCVEEVKYNAVVMGKNYSGKLDEPTQLPVRIPISIINGANGIAVGFSTNMPQHNPTEAMKVARLLLKDPKASLKRIMNLMPGPDFVTGGVVMGTSGIKDYYSTGRGRLIIRAKYRIEQGIGGKSTIVFYEVPPFVSVDQCQSALNDIFDSETYKDSKDKKKAQQYHTLSHARSVLNGISRAVDLTDFETGNGVDYEIELKASANPNAIIMALYKYTPLQSSFSVNNTVVYDGLPRVANIRELFIQFLDFRRKCVKRVSESKLEIDNNRIHMIDGILAILLDLDKAIAIIRKSDSEDMARARLMRTFSIDEKQARYILDMQLKKLTHQNSLELKAEKDKLTADKAFHEGVISDPKKCDAEVDRLLVQSSKIIDDKRYMEILDVSDDDIADMDKDMKSSARQVGKDLPCIITVSSDGKNLIKTLNKEPSYRHYRQTIKSSNQHRMIAVGNDGIGYTMTPSYIMDDKDITVNAAFAIPGAVHSVGIVSDGDRILSVSSDGIVKITHSQFNDKWASHVIQGLKTSSSQLVYATTLPDEGIKKYQNAQIVLVSRKGKAIRFPLSELNETGLGAAGVCGMKLRDDSVVGASVVLDAAVDTLITLSHATVKSTAVKEIPLQRRAGAGVILQRVIKGDAIIAMAVGGKILKGRSIIPIKNTRRDGLAVPVPSKNVRLVQQ